MCKSCRSEGRIAREQRQSIVHPGEKEQESQSNADVEIAVRQHAKLTGRTEM